MSVIRHAGQAAVVTLALHAAACTDASLLDSRVELASGAVRYEIVAGELQSAPAGTELPDPLIVRVMTPEGRPVEGQIVNWIVTGGSGSVFGGRALTNAEGLAQEWWTLGPVPGDNTLEVRAVDASTGEPLVFGRFQATGTDSTATESAPAPPSTISISAVASKAKGLQKVDLAWSGAEGGSVEIYRDDALLARTSNDGTHHDAIDGRGSGSYRYRVCEEASANCSGEVQVNF